MPQKTANFRAKPWFRCHGVYVAVAILTWITLGGCVKKTNIANLDSNGSTIICFGDSLTRGHAARADQAYPARLSARLGVPVVNAGRDGDTTAQALKRIDRDVIRKHPRMVLVFLGGNDVLHRIPKRETLANMDRILARCVSSGAIVVVIHTKYGLFKDPYRKDFEQLADKYGAVFVPNVLNGIFGRPSLMSDEIHPNAAGYDLVAERIAQRIAPVLAQADTRRRVSANAHSRP